MQSKASFLVFSHSSSNIVWVKIVSILDSVRWSCFWWTCVHWNFIWSILKNPTFELLQTISLCEFLVSLKQHPDFEAKNQWFYTLCIYCFHSLKNTFSVLKDKDDFPIELKEVLKGRFLKIGLSVNRIAASLNFDMNEPKTKCLN